MNVDIFVLENKGRILHASTLKLDQCNGNKVCEFFYRSYGNKPNLEIEYFGQAIPKSETNPRHYFFLEGYSKQEMNLGRGLTIKGK